MIENQSKLFNHCYNCSILIKSSNNYFNSVIFRNNICHKCFAKMINEQALKLIGVESVEVLSYVAW